MTEELCRGILRRSSAAKSLRTLQAAEIAGIRAMLVHAISSEAARFYRYFGFQPTPGSEMTLMVTLSALAAGLG